jgi:hypothetical protein
MDLVAALRRGDIGAREELESRCRGPILVVVRDIIDRLRLNQNVNLLAEYTLRWAEMHLCIQDPAKFEGLADSDDLSWEVFSQYVGLKAGQMLWNPLPAGHWLRFCLRWLRFLTAPMWRHVVSRAYSRKSGRISLCDSRAFLVSVFSRPLDLVGGDWCTSTSQGDALWVLLADVCGKSWPVYVLSQGLRSLWDFCLSAPPPADPAGMLTILDGHLQRCLPGDLFIEATVARLDAKPPEQVAVAAAGRSLVLRRDASQRAANWHQLGGLFLGLGQGEPYDQSVWTLRVGDEMLLSSDGLLDQPAGLERLEVHLKSLDAAGASRAMLTLLSSKLKLNEADLYPMAAEVDYSGLWGIVAQNRSELHDPPWQPVAPVALGDEGDDLFALLRKGDVLVHHPYESFDASVARFIRAAADDPKVQALKMTVYRIGSDTPFIDALIRAAESGKQVACLVEITARFDEQQNLLWAEKLNRVGVHVIYGVMGLKTHAKVALAVRRDDDGLRSYAHVGTGNYHVKTARLYTDLGLLTCDPVLTGDVVKLFHFLTGGAYGRTYDILLVAPVAMRQRFLEMIEREVEHHRAGRPARIVAKMNQLEDREICEAIVQASRAGLPIDLIVRGFSVLAAGVPRATDNVRIISVTGRSLEHSRIYFFQNGSPDPRLTAVGFL